MYLTLLRAFSAFLILSSRRGNRAQMAGNIHIGCQQKYFIFDCFLIGNMPLFGHPLTFVLCGHHIGISSLVSFLPSLGCTPSFFPFPETIYHPAERTMARADPAFQSYVTLLVERLRDTRAFQSRRNFLYETLARFYHMGKGWEDFPRYSHGVFCSRPAHISISNYLSLDMPASGLRVGEPQSPFQYSFE